MTNARVLSTSWNKRQVTIKTSVEPSTEAGFNPSDKSLKSDTEPISQPKYELNKHLLFCAKHPCGRVGEAKCVYALLFMDKSRGSGLQDRGPGRFARRQKAASG